MRKLRNELIKAGVEEYCKQIGISMEEIFLNDSEVECGKNQEYEWSVRDNPTPNLLGGQVVYAVPKETNDLFWEAWYILEHKFYHRVLSEVKIEQCDGIVEISADDKYHPEIALGKSWYYYDDLSTIPIKMRK